VQQPHPWLRDNCWKSYSMPTNASRGINHSSIDSFTYMCKDRVNKDDEKDMN
jgi:hypothetical protein